MPTTIATQLGDRAKLIAEPWGVVAGSYAVGKFPAPWAEWNDKFRDTIRSDQDQAGTVAITPGALAERIGGSQGTYGSRTPQAGVSYLVSHDGFTLRDLYGCNSSNNTQAWPYGPSDGGSTDNKSWDHGGDAALRHQAQRTGLALMMLSAGVPMITGGDEAGRGTHCNNNPYNLDSTGSWLDWANRDTTLVTFAQRLFAFRAAHPALRPTDWSEKPTWLDGYGNAATSAYLGDATKSVLAWRTGELYVAYNRGAAQVTLTLPAAPAGTAWYRAADTSAALEPTNFAVPGSEYRMMGSSYGLSARSLAIFIAQ